MIWHEEEHPRDDLGQFTEKGNAGGNPDKKEFRQNASYDEILEEDRQVSLSKQEWALYHRNLGFTKIFLFDDKSSRSYDEELGDLIKSGFVEIQQVNDERWSRQVRVFNSFVHSKEWEEDDWCAFIDVDEFLFFEDGKSVSEFLESYRLYAAVALFWKNYNANGRIETPKVISTIEAYTEECFSNHMGPCVKLVAQLKYIQNCPDVHYFTPKSGKIIVNTEEREFGQALGCLLAKSYSRGYIKHYITKSWEDYIRRLKRGNVTKGVRTIETFFKLNPDMNKIRGKLTKDLDYSEFPTLERGAEKWDGDL